MILCNKDCIPCCNFCLYSMHERIPVDGKMINGTPIECFKHPDIEHQEIAENCEYCDDFHCFSAKLKPEFHQEIGNKYENN